MAQGKAIQPDPFAADTVGIIPEESYESPTPADERLWHFLQQMANDSAQVRNAEGHFDQLEDWMALFRGDHYPEIMPSYRPPVVVNELRTLVLQEANDLSDTGFRPYVMRDPRTGGRDEAAERALRALWVREEIDLKLLEAITWACSIGTGFLRVTWDPDKFYGMGDVSVEAIDPMTVLPDGDVADEREAAYILYESVLDLEDIRRLFPKKGYLVTPEDEYSMHDSSVTLGGSRLTASLSPGQPYEGPLTETDSLIGRSYPGYKKARARVLDAFLNDNEVVTTIEPVLDPILRVPMKDEAGNPVLLESKKMKYPNGRRVVGANGVILYDGENPNPRGDKGLVKIVLEPGLGKFWGTGFIQQTSSLQLAADKLQSAVIENGIRLNNGILVATGNTGLDWETFAGIPGQIIQINQGGTFEIKYPPAMPPDMIQAPIQMLDLQRRILGFSDPRMGAGGRGNVSPELTEVEISQSQGPTRLRAKYLYHAVQRLAEMIFARMTANYTVKRAIPAVEGESFKPVVWEPVSEPDRYAVFVDPATFQIMSRSMLRRLSLALYRMGTIDRRAVLETIGWPNWEETASRLDEAEKMAAMAKMQSRKRNKT